MKIILESEEALTLLPTDGALTIEAASDELGYSAFHMLGGALGYCTFSVLRAWATNAKLQVDDLSMRVEWTFADQPHRVSEFRLIFKWPSLPAGRVAAARRAADLCGVHNTLTHPPAITVDHSS